MSDVTTGKSGGNIYEQLRPMFFPRSIAVVGVSKEQWKPGTGMLRSLQRFGFSGQLYPVSNRGGELLGHQVYTSLREIPGEVDLACLFVPNTAMASVLRDCRAKGVRAVIAFTSGFSETGAENGKALEAELLGELDGSFRMLGPNCLGAYCPAGGVTQHPGGYYTRESGEVAVIAQSGGLSEDIARATVSHGFRVSKVVSYGNACDLNEADLLEYAEADPATSIIGMYIEGPRNGRKFAQVLRRVAAKKPVVVWKGGLTPNGAKAAASHTGSLAGSLEVWKAFLHQAGAIAVSSAEELLDTLAAFHFLPGYCDQRIGYVAAGGGNSVAASDASYRAGLSIPHVSPKVKAEIASFLPPVGSSAANPIDTLDPVPPAKVLKGVLETLAGSGEVGAIIIDKIVMSVELRELLKYSEQLAEQDEPWLPELPMQIQKAYGLPVVVVLREGTDPTGDVESEAARVRLARYYQDNGIAVYPTADRAFRAIGHVVDYYRRIGQNGKASE